MSELLTWFRHIWGRTGEPVENAAELARQYRLMKANCPMAMADLSAFCYAHETVLDTGNVHETVRMAAMRDVFLHIQTMAGLTPLDLQRFREMLSSGTFLTPTTEDDDDDGTDG